MMGQRFPSRRVLAHQAEVNCQCYPPVLVAPATSVRVEDLKVIHDESPL